MLSANLNDEKVFAFHVNDKNASYHCPLCKSNVILKKGKIKTHHFAHKNNNDCDWGGESESHMKTKLEIYNFLISKGFQADMEVIIDNSKADIFAVIDNRPVVIEIQNSQLSELEIIRRTNYYYKNIPNVAINWISTIDIQKLREKNDHCYKTKEGYKIDKYTPKQFERWLDNILPASLWFFDPKTSLIYKGSFSTHYIEVPHSDYDGGRGGYEKPSKRWVKLSLEEMQLEQMTPYTHQGKIPTGLVYKGRIDRQLGEIFNFKNTP